jgi:hypothetical protein
MNALQSVMKMHARTMYWFLSPLVIIVASFIMSLLMSWLFHGNGAVFYGGINYVSVFFFIFGIVSLHDTFSFALGFSVRRTDYFLGTLLLVVVLSVATALLTVLLAFVQSHVIHGGDGRLPFFSLSSVKNSSPGEHLWIYFVTQIHMYFLGFAIGSIYQRVGKAGMWAFFVFAFLLVSLSIFLSTSLHWGIASFSWLSQPITFEFALWLALLSVCYMLVSYVLLRKATI